MNYVKKVILFSIVAILAVAILTPVITYAACSSVPNGSYPKTLLGNTTYCLTNNVTVSGTSAFIIGGDNITFDLGGFEIKNDILGSGNGIESQTSRKNITIKNGRINGFSNAITLTPEFHDNVVIDGIVAVNSTSDGITVEGRGVVVSNCKIMSASWGIIVMGSGLHVVNNDIYKASVTGIHVNWGGVTHEEGTGNIVEDNRISSNILNANSTGIQAISYTDTILVNNRISNRSTGIAVTGTGKYRDNLTFNCTVPYQMSPGVIDAGNNN